MGLAVWWTFACAEIVIGRGVRQRDAGTCPFAQKRNGRHPELHVATPVGRTYSSDGRGRLAGMAAKAGSPKDSFAVGMVLVKLRECEMSMVLCRVHMLNAPGRSVREHALLGLTLVRKTSAHFLAQPPPRLADVPYLFLGPISLPALKHRPWRLLNT